MYRGHRSDGSMMWMSLSRTLKLPCAMSASPSARVTTVWWGPYARCALVVKGRGLRRPRGPPVGADPDSSPGHRLLAGLRDHGGGHGQPALHHGDRHGAGHAGDAGLGG